MPPKKNRGYGAQGKMASRMVNLKGSTSRSEILLQDLRDPARTTANVFLTCDEGEVQVHSFLISQASLLIRNILQDVDPLERTVVYFDDVHLRHLQLLFDLLYTGTSVLKTRDHKPLHDLLTSLKIPVEEVEVRFIKSKDDPFQPEFSPKCDSITKPTAIIKPEEIKTRRTRKKRNAIRPENLDGMDGPKKPGRSRRSLPPSPPPQYHVPPRINYQETLDGMLGIDPPKKRPKGRPRKIILISETEKILSTGKPTLGEKSSAPDSRHRNNSSAENRIFLDQITIQGVVYNRYCGADGDPRKAIAVRATQDDSVPVN